MRARAGVARSADGVSLAYEVTGEGRYTVALVHGWTCDRSCWRPLVAHLAPRYRVVTLDLAGHGESGAGRDPWTIAAMAGDVVTVLRDVGAMDVVIAGHSMGGALALEAAIAMGSRATGVIGVDAFFDVWSDPAWESLAAQVAADYTTTVRGFVKSPLWFTPQSPPGLAQRMADAMAAADPRMAVPLVADLGAWARTRAPVALREWLGPMGLLMQRGGGSLVGKWREARSGLPTLEPAEMPVGGHFVMYEDPSAFTQLVAATLDRVVSAQPAGRAM